jgi:hypothetical protein
MFKIKFDIFQPPQGLARIALLVVNMWKELER